MLIVSCALLILVNDQTCNLFKSGIERFRPTHDPVLGGLVETVNGYRGGKYGFYSAHAACSFATAMFVSCLRSDAHKAFIVSAFSYAALVSYSRIYLGVHFPSDVIVGAIAGILTGWLFAAGYKKLYRYMENRKTM
jgi:undecaprenyl-diphosphatase